jgi:hypothetical protein
VDPDGRGGLLLLIASVNLVNLLAQPPAARGRWPRDPPSAPPAADRPQPVVEPMLLGDRGSLLGFSPSPRAQGVDVGIARLAFVTVDGACCCSPCSSAGDRVATAWCRPGRPPRGAGSGAEGRRARRRGLPVSGVSGRFWSARKWRWR